jgi:hypothetical protein
MHAASRSDASGSLSTGACEDVTQSEVANAADQSQAAAGKGYAIENDLRSTLRNFGFKVKVGMVGTAKFETRIKRSLSRSSRFSRAGGTVARCPAGAS